MDLKTHATGQKHGGENEAPQRAFLAVSESRAEHLAQALSEEGASIVLTGEPGCGKSYLARQAAYALAANVHHPVHQLLVHRCKDLLELAGLISTAPAQEASRRVLDSLLKRFAPGEVIIVALGIDQYHGEDAAFLEHLVRAHRVRFIGTAQQIVGAADRLARDPGVLLQAIEPLTRDESQQFLSKLLGVDEFAGPSLDDWYAATLGNVHALETLALAADRRGAIQRARRIAWINPRENRPPADFVAQLEEFSEIEQRALELVSFASPMHEASLLQLLDSDTVSKLLNRQVLVVRTDRSGVTTLVTRLPILAAAIREHLAPATRIALATLCFNALLSEDASLSPANRKRLVQFGLTAGRELPAAWMWQAMHAADRAGDLHYTLRLALAAMPHEDPQRSAEAILRACDLAHFLGAAEALDEAMLALRALIEHSETFEALPFEMQFKLAATSICVAPKYVAEPEFALAAFEQWERHWASRGIDASHHTTACKMRVLTLNGHLRSALETGAPATGEHDLNTEWLSAPARTFEALIRLQKGQFQAALTLAENTRKIVMLHDISPTTSGDLEGFVAFLAHWARGTTISARHTLEQVATPTRADLSAVQARTGFIDLGIVLFCLQEARWNDAAELSERLLKTIASHDPFGIVPLVHVTAALAFAALGESDRARTSLQYSEMLSRPGVASALHGFAGNLALRARHWLRDPELIAHAQQLADWTRTQDMPLVELKALDVIAHESVSPDPALLARAEAIAPLIEQPVGPAILAHIKAMTQPGGDADPDERLLSELGIWMPLPPVSKLTGREREIALFTALGYSSKYVAERLQLSARTVETHLAHVYGKLGIDGREELRRWFSRGRENG